MVWARKRTIPTEQPPLVGKVIANFLQIEGVTWSAWRIPTSVFSTFLSSSSSVVLTRLSGPLNMKANTHEKENDAVVTRDPEIRLPTTWSLLRECRSSISSLSCLCNAALSFETIYNQTIGWLVCAGLLELEFAGKFQVLEENLSGSSVTISITNPTWFDLRSNSVSSGGVNTISIINPTWSVIELVSNGGVNILTAAARGRNFCFVSDTRIVTSMRMGPLERNCDLTWHPNYIGLCCRDGKTIRQMEEGKVAMCLINSSKNHQDVWGKSALTPHCGVCSTSCPGRFASMDVVPAVIWLRGSGSQSSYGCWREGKYLLLLQETEHRPSILQSMAVLILLSRLWLTGKNLKQPWK
jgi:hypothetical protein